MRFIFTSIFAFILTTGLSAQVSKTVGVSDSTYNFPTVGAAFAAINSGTITDGNGNPADSVTLVLMDSVYNESEISLAPMFGYPSVVIMDGDAINPTINITQVLGTGVGFKIDSLESFVHSCVNISLDTAFTWTSAIEIYQPKEWIKPCPSHVMSIYAPTAEIGINVQSTACGEFTLQNCTIDRIKKGTNLLLPSVCDGRIVITGNTFEYSDSAVVLNGIGAHAIDISENTFTNVGTAIVTDSVGADSIVVSNNNATFGYPSLQSKQEHISQSNSISSDRGRFSHFKDHRGQGMDNIIVITNNTLTAIDTADAGISLDGISRGIVRIDSNMIDMDGGGIAITAHPRYCRPNDGRLIFMMTRNDVSNASSGIDIELNNDTTGLGGVDPDSLTFGVFNIDGNSITNTVGGVGIIRDLNPIWGHQGHTNKVAITNNTITGSIDPNNPGLVGIDLDSLRMDTLDITSNSISGFVRSITNMHSAHEHPPFDQKYSINENIITAAGADTGKGILLSGIPCNMTVEGNTINMNGGGVAIKIEPAWNGYDGTCQEESDGRMYRSNIITNANTGIMIELDNDTTGLGDVPPDSLTFGLFDIVDNVMSNVKSGHHFGYNKQGADWPGKAGIQRLRFTNNILNGDGSPGSVGIDIDSIRVGLVEVDSNTINGFGKAYKKVIFGSGDEHWGEISHMTYNSFIGDVEITAENMIFDISDNQFQGGDQFSLTKLNNEPFCVPLPMEDPFSLTIRNNTFTGFTEDGMTLTIDTTDCDSVKILIENNALSDNGGNGLEIVVDGDSGLVVVEAIGNTFSNNGENGIEHKGRGGAFSHFKDHRGQGHENFVMPKTSPSGRHQGLSGAVYSPNLFTNNAGSGLVLDGAVLVPDGIHYQNFSGNGVYHFFNGTDQTVDAAGNWWGTGDSATIALTIFDGNDSAGLGVMSFMPFLTDSVSAAISEVDIEMNAGWNLVSVPVKLIDYSKDILFPDAVSDAFSYNGVYSTDDELSNAVGYWVKFGTAGSATMTGLTLSVDSIDVLQGWNLVGSISSPVSVNEITSVPGGIVTSQFFGYSSGYQIADSVRPGKGYWVKVSEAGKLVLATAPGAAPAAIHIVPTDEFPPAPPNGEHRTSNIPDRFSLDQNYPNPFNPATVIRYQLPVKSSVTMTVYNMLGQEVAAPLLDRQMNEGSHRIEFNASDLPSGVYVYKLVAQPVDRENGPANFSDVKKMMLIR